MSALTESIRELYQGNISDGEAELATNNLLELFSIFAQVDARFQTEANSHEKAITPSQGTTAKLHLKNQRITCKSI